MIIILIIKMHQFAKKAAGKMPAAKNQKVILLCYA